jgi:hypothetical protein
LVCEGWCICQRRRSLLGGIASLQSSFSSLFFTFFLQLFLFPLMNLALTVVLIMELREALAVDAGMSALNLL